MRVLVTGATGFLGSHVAEQLARQGHAVRVLVRRTSDRTFLQGFEAEEALGEVTQPESLPAVVDGVEAIVHAAGLTKARSAAEFEAVNARATSELARAAAGSGVQRFLYVSSLAAAGPSADGRPRTEEMPLEPISAYGRSKARAEAHVREQVGDERWTIIRPPIVYGPGDRALLPVFRMVACGVVPLVGFGSRHYSLIHVSDLVRGIAEALAHPQAAGRVWLWTPSSTTSTSLSTTTSSWTSPTSKTWWMR